MFFKIQKLDFLIALFVFCTVVAELMGSKTFYLMQIGGFKLNASVAIFVIPIVYLIDDVITEVYGKTRARSIVYSGAIIIFLLSLFSILATRLSPSTRFLPLEQAYDSIFDFTIRLSIASLSAFLLAELLDVYIFSSLRQKFGRQHLWLRTNLSNITSEFVDTLVFMVTAFYSLGLSFKENYLFLAGLILPYWLLKCLLSVIETPFVYLGVAWIRKGNDED
jgi:uncharacterized integral membrane protein (TIGR00697 family)